MSGRHVDYRCIAMDPPWMERGGGKSKRGADRHYPLMGRHDIAATVLRSLAWRPADDVHLWMWATSNHLPDALWLIDALGFRYVTQAVWLKLRSSSKADDDVRQAALSGSPIDEVLSTGLATGLGQYLRGQHELLLLATRGRGAAVRTDRRDIPSVILGHRGTHSAKPSAAYKMIEARSRGPRLEMFARDPRPGWTTWSPMPGHRWVVSECGRMRSGHQTYEEAVLWCHLHGAANDASVTGDIVLSDGVTITEVTDGE